MREIKFRGLIKTGIWVKGHYVVDPVWNENNVIEWQPMIQSFDDEGNEDCNMIKVDTLGQFTGEYDTQGDEIYEGDILDTPWGNEEVIFSDSCFRMRPCGNVLTYDVKRNRCTIIGNVHQNKNLLNDDR